MKNKYMRLSKEEKRKAESDYIKESDKNKSAFNALKRLKLLSIFGTIYSIVMFALDFFTNLTGSTVWSFIIDAVLLVFSVLMFVEQDRLRIRYINNFLINKKGK
ncbi:MAG TPA: hypothetical protein PLB45_04345 [Bacilli bacterium]|nr:hypothetical protein [Bacilli bacterium]HQC84083.1 hypothetical protein [Bacilli bacterium]